MVNNITQEQREEAKLNALLAEGPWLSEHGNTAFEHEQIGVLSAITSISLALQMGVPITAGLLLSMAEKAVELTSEDVYGEIPREAI